MSNILPFFFKFTGRKFRHSSTAMDSTVFKIVFVGNGGSGKTALLRTFTERRSMMEYTEPLVSFEKHSANIEHEGTSKKLELFDTAGQELGAIDLMRSLAYPDTDVVVICYSIGEPDTLLSVSHKVMVHVY